MYAAPAGSNNTTALPAFVEGQIGNRRHFQRSGNHLGCGPSFALPCRNQILTDGADATVKSTQTPGQEQASRDTWRLGAGAAIASAACAISLAGLTTFAPGASAVELSRGGHPLTVERELLEGLLLDNAQSKLRSLSDEDLLALFRDVVTGIAPSIREAELVKERTFLSRLSPFRGSSQSQQQPTESASTGGEPLEDRVSSAESAKQSGARGQLQPEGTVRLTQDMEESREEKRGPPSATQPAVGSSSSQIGDAAATGEIAEKQGTDGADNRPEVTADATAALLESSGVVLPPKSSTDTPESARQQGAGASIVRGGLGAAASIAQGVGGALIAATVALQRSSVAAPAISLAGLVALVYIFFRTLSSKELEEEGQPEGQSSSESRTREGPKEGPKLPTAEKADGWKETPPKALEKLGLKPPTEIPKSLRQLPALSFLSRVVRLEGGESAGTIPTAQESRSQAELPSGSDGGNGTARGRGERTERDQAVTTPPDPQRIAPQAPQKLRPPVSQPASSLPEAQRQANEAVLWRRRAQSMVPLNEARDAATLDRPKATPSAQSRPTAGPQDIQPSTGPVLWQRKAQSYRGGSGRPSASIRQRLRSEQRSADSDAPQRGRDLFRTRAAAAPTASSSQQRHVVQWQGSPTFGRNEGVDESYKHGSTPVVGGAPASPGRLSHAKQAEKGVSELSLHTPEVAAEPSRSGARGADQALRAATPEGRETRADESAGGGKQAAGFASTQTAGLEAPPITAHIDAVAKTVTEGSDAALREPSAAERDHSDRSDAAGGEESSGLVGTLIRWPQQEGEVGIASSMAARANGRVTLSEVDAVGLHDSSLADVLPQPSEEASGRGPAPLKGAVGSLGNDEAGGCDSASWRGFLSDGSLGTEDEACFPRPQDRDAFRLKQAHRRRKRRRSVPMNH